MNPNSCRFLSQKWVFIVFTSITFILVSFVPLVLAEEFSDEQSGWEFQVAPYFWFLSIDGDVTVKGQQSDVDVGFDKIWDEFNIGAMLEFEARKDRWGLYGDTIAANLGHSTTVEGVDIDPDINILFLTLGGFTGWAPGTSQMPRARRHRL